MVTKHGTMYDAKSIPDTLLALGSPVPDSIHAAWDSMIREQLACKQREEVQKQHRNPGQLALGAHSSMWKGAQGLASPKRKPVALSVAASRGVKRKAIVVTLPENLPESQRQHAAPCQAVAAGPDIEKWLRKDGMDSLCMKPIVEQESIVESMSQEQLVQLAKARLAVYAKSMDREKRWKKSLVVKNQQIRRLKEKGRKLQEQLVATRDQEGDALQVQRHKKSRLTWKGHIVLGLRKS